VIRPRRLTPALVAVALVSLLALVETVNALTAPARVASRDDWQAAAAEVRAGFRAGDLIVFAPYWADQRGRSVLGDLVPVEMAGRADADRYGRVWELSIRGAHAPEAAGAHLVRASAHGKVRLALYEKPAVTVLWDGTSHAGDARVTQTLGAAETPCYRESGASFRCASTHVERRTLEIDYQPRRGLLTPVDGARTTHVAWDGVPLGRALVVYAGIHDYYARKNADGLVDLRVTVDGRTLVQARVGNADGWRRFDLDTHALAGSAHTVRVDVSARNPAWRTFGFHIEARK
jgi:hypothetical protein